MPVSRLLAKARALNATVPGVHATDPREVIDC